MTFDERADVVSCATPWGRWWQTVGDVQVEVVCEERVDAKVVRCRISNTSLSLDVGGVTLMDGKLFGGVHADESTWTLEDGRVVRILLAKALPDAANLWRSLLTADAPQPFAADAYTLDQMQRKLTLERLQTENPGMDFSGADITGNYQDGGPRLPIN